MTKAELAELRYGGPGARGRRVAARVCRRVGRPEHDQPVRSEKLGERPSEGRGHVVLCTIMAGQPPEDVRSEFRFVTVVDELRENGIDVVPELFAIERKRWGVVLSVPEHEPLDRVGRAQGIQMIGFGEVVVVSGHPEYRSYHSSQYVGAGPCHGNRGQRLVHGKQRSQEEARLLPSRDAQGVTVEQAIEIALCLIVRDKRAPERRIQGASASDQRWEVETGQRAQRGRSKRQAHVLTANRMARGERGVRSAPL